MHHKLKEFFEKKGINQQEIADALGVSQTYVNAILNGKKAIGKKSADKFANLFGLSKSFLLTGEGEPEKTTEFSPQSNIDTSSLVNALIAAKDETIESLKRENEILHSRITDLERKIANLTMSDIKDYPFPVGTSEPKINEYGK